MKKQLMKVVVCLGVILAAFSVNKTSAKAYTTGTLSNDGHLYSNGHMVINDFVFDGTYTYYAQADTDERSFDLSSGWSTHYLF